MLAAFPCLSLLFGCICPVLTAETQSQFKISSGLDNFWRENTVQLWPGDPAVVWWSSACPPNLSAVTYLSPQGWGGLLWLSSPLLAHEMQSELRRCHEPGQADSSHLILQRTNRAQGKVLKFHRDLFLKHYNQVERFQLSH